MNINIEISTLDEFKKIILNKDEEIIKLLSEIEDETEIISKSFSTNVMDKINKEIIDYYINQNKVFKYYSDMYVKKLDKSVQLYKDTINDIKGGIK